MGTVDRRLRTARVALSAITGASLAALAQPCLAQDAAAPAAGDAQSNGVIVVTGSRIARDGSEAPQPVTVVGTDLLQQRAATNVADTLNELPAFRPLVTPATQQAVGGNVGARVLDLRGLGAERTLVLLDGKRFVPSHPARHGRHQPHPHAAGPARRDRHRRRLGGLWLGRGGGRRQLHPRQGIHWPSRNRAVRHLTGGGCRGLLRRAGLRHEVRRRARPPHDCRRIRQERGPGRLLHARLVPQRNGAARRRQRHRQDRARWPRAARLVGRGRVCLGRPRGWPIPGNDLQPRRQPAPVPVRPVARWWNYVHPQPGRRGRAL